ncbi:MAG: hypothetical protein HOA17_06380 [Candidatus Melainabacteria bacterium]|jgi:hypothetical protein|nr:hypothetical protein [Candidatus Melainabacteria bacterium]
MQDDSSIDEIYQELKKRQVDKPTEQKSEFAEKFVTDLLRNSDKDISLGEYLSISTPEEEVTEIKTVTNKLIGLLDDLEKEIGMEDEILELDELDLGCMTGKARNELQKNLFINHKKKVRQSGDNRIRSYSNTNVKIGKEASMSPLSLKRYQAD